MIRRLWLRLRRVLRRRDPWTDPDPQPGDFDIDVELARPGDVETHEGFRRMV
jgi:hypothetical protein